MDVRHWLEAAVDGRTLRRSLAIALVVGTALAALIHGSALIRGAVAPEQARQVALFYLLPFMVSMLAALLAVRGRADGHADYVLLEREIEAINKFPGRNPNPVMRMTPAGQLIYANDASRPILDAIGATVDAPLPADIAARLQESARAETPWPVPVEAGLRSYELLPIDVPELDVVNVYGTDVTAARVVARFPDRNPFPVLREAKDGSLLYANQASEPISRPSGSGRPPIAPPRRGWPGWRATSRSRWPPTDAPSS